LRVSDGPVFGALSAMDRRPRAWDEDARRLLSDLAAIAVREIEHRIVEQTPADARIPARFARLINLLPVGLYLCDPEGRIVFYNERAVELWDNAPGLPCDEMAAFGQRRLRRLDGAELDVDELPGSIALRQRTTVNNREFSLAPDRTVLLSWGPSLGRDDRLLGAVVVMQDVTEIRRAARLRDDLLSLVSHELRTPLTVINGMARALERRLQAGGDPEQRMALGDIIVAGQRMERVVENMLLLSRIEYEAAETEPVLVAAAVEAALERHHRDYPRSMVEVEIREPGLMVDAVPSWLQRILVNLLNNAEQYGDRRRPHQFTAYADGDTACLSLCNSGTLSLGEDRDSWFEPFYRGAATAALVAGAGLGLTVAKRLAEAQAGTIAAERWPGDPEGTMVTLRLPRARDQAAEH
jgi:signal transduction histidine kinase